MLWNYIVVRLIELVMYLFKLVKLIEVCFIESACAAKNSVSPSESSEAFGVGWVLMMRFFWFPAEVALFLSFFVFKNYISFCPSKIEHMNILYQNLYLLYRCLFHVDLFHSQFTKKMRNRLKQNIWGYLSAWYIINVCILHARICMISS